MQEISKMNLIVNKGQIEICNQNSDDQNLKKDKTNSNLRKR